MMIFIIMCTDSIIANSAYYIHKVTVTLTFLVPEGPDRAASSGPILSPGNGVDGLGQSQGTGQVSKGDQTGGEWLSHTHNT